ncbi:hypothetical protein POM88_036471 [Heracleum sosnowskyi]|uniref:Uncharacterized protein n=1 Tax=Heracleum sosnowskyi TaxID=360622 RepID=A0AAD8HPU8_9APIA|nr:hypothetical protein POM88_036471 [Heracleum sosnowskyi]
MIEKILICPFQLKYLCLLSHCKGCVLALAYFGSKIAKRSILCDATERFANTGIVQHLNSMMQFPQAMNQYLSPQNYVLQAQPKSLLFAVNDLEGRQLGRVLNEQVTCSLIDGKLFSVIIVAPTEGSGLQEGYPLLDNGDGDLVTKKTQQNNEQRQQHQHGAVRKISQNSDCTHYKQDKEVYGGNNTRFDDSVSNSSQRNDQAPKMMLMQTINAIDEIIKTKGWYLGEITVRKKKMTWSGKLPCMVRISWILKYYITGCIKEGEGEGEGEGEEEEGGTKYKYFYKNLRGQSRFEATHSIKEHVKRSCKRMMNEEKDRLHTKMAETGMSAQDLRPSYFHPILWDQLLKFWDSEGHKHRASVGANNRKKVSTLHSAGAKPFEAIEMATTNGAEKPKKNRLIGFPNVPASSLLPDLAHHYREGTRGGASSSSSAPNRSPTIPDHLFMQVVRHVVTSAQADPTYFQRQLDDRELEGLARNLLEVSDPESMGNFNNVFFREVVNVVTSIMKDICNKYEEETQAAIEEANQEFTEGESSEYDDSGSDGEAGRANDDHGDAEM